MNLNFLALLVISLSLLGAAPGIASGAPTSGENATDVGIWSLLTPCIAGLSTNNTLKQGQIPDILQPGIKLPLYTAGMIVGGVEILYTNLDFLRDANFKGLGVLYQRQSQKQATVFILNDGRYIYGDITDGDYISKTQTDNPNAGEIVINNKTRITVGDIKAFGRPIRDASAIVKVVGESPAIHDPALAAIRARAEKYGGLSIEEQEVYDMLLTLKTDSRYDLSITAKNAPPRDVTFIHLEKHRRPNDRITVVAFFREKDLIADTSSTIVIPISKISLKPDPDKKDSYTISDFNNSPDARTTNLEKELLKQIRNKSQADKLDSIYFDPIFGRQFTNLSMRMLPGTLELKVVDGYYWLDFASDARFYSVPLKAVKELAINKL